MSFIGYRLFFRGKRIIFELGFAYKGVEPSVNDPTVWPHRVLRIMQVQERDGLTCFLLIEQERGVLH